MREAFEAHLEKCPQCRDLWEEYNTLFGKGALLEQLDPPQEVFETLTASPCARRLSMLFSAIDRELPSEQLDQLFEHLETCPECRGVWGDFSLIHQAGDALVPPADLMTSCLRHEAPVHHRPVLGRKTATAAAYFLAVLTSLAIGNPVTFARYNQAASAVSQFKSVVAPEVSRARDIGRGEIRVMLWRGLRWSGETLQALQTQMDTLLGKDSEAHPDQEKEGQS